MENRFSAALIVALLVLAGPSSAGPDPEPNAAAPASAAPTANQLDGLDREGQLFVIAYAKAKKTNKGVPLTQDQINAIVESSKISPEKASALLKSLYPQDAVPATPPIPATPSAPANTPSVPAKGMPSMSVPAATDGTDPTPPAANKIGPNFSFVNGLENWMVSKNPNNPAFLAQRGLDNLREGNVQAAFGDLGAAVAAGDQSNATLQGYGSAAYDLKNYPVAISAAQAILDKAPADKGALALYYFSKQQLPAGFTPSALGRASGDISSLIAGGNGSSIDAAQLPTGAAAHGSVFFGGSGGPPPPAGMTAEQAIALAKQAAEPGSDAPARSRQFTKDAANAMRQRDYPTSYELATQAVNLNPENAQALNYRAMSSSQMRHYAEAVQDASAALGLAPGNPAALHTRSWAFSKEGKYNEGLADAVAASAAEPSNAFLYQDKAFALAGLGDHPGTLDALAHSAALDPRFKARYERAVQLPQDSDMTLLFDDGSTAAPMAAAPPAPGERQRRFLRLAVLSAVGGLLIALGVLHVVSASWRERMRMTVRRVLGPSSSVSADSTVVLDSPSAGAFWTQYRLIKEIGLGGMGVVYEAMDLSLERRVAVKKMRDEIRLDADDRRRFVNEARLVAQLHHPNIVDIYGIVEDGADVYLVFEFVEGRTLQDALKSGGPMELTRARDVIKEMAEAVTHAHERNVIHRDLKPSNVMQTPEGRIKVMDFGVARQAKDAMTRHSQTNSNAGTPPYMAPEQEQGNVRKESDVYALGVCLYEMTTGQLPFNGYGAAMLLNKLNGKLIAPTQRVASLPAGFDAVIAKALAPDPDNRYRTPAELVAALDALLTTAA
jgi:tetratricopeptide (TPR) repeat protein